MLPHRRGSPAFSPTRLLQSRTDTPRADHRPEQCCNNNAQRLAGNVKPRWDLHGREAGKRVQVILRLNVRAARLFQTSIVDDDNIRRPGQYSERLRAPSAQTGRCQVPFLARMDKVFARPALLLPSSGPDDARQRPNGPDRAEHPARLNVAHITRCAAGRKHRSHGAVMCEPCFQKRHRGSGNRPGTMFFSVRTKQSSQATFLVSEETEAHRDPPRF